MSTTDRLDADRLLAMARDRSTQGRTELANTIAELFDQGSGRLSDREKSLMYGILQHLVRETERSVREIISAQVAERDDVPRGLATMLADDSIEVAYPILTRCSVLKDADLIEIIRGRAFEHRLAIALRYDVSERVSSELVGTGNGDVIVALLENPNARIAQATLAYLVEESERVDSFRQPVLQRSELGPELAKKMFAWVSAALRTYIIEKYQLDSATVDELLARAGEAGGEHPGQEKHQSKTDLLAADLAQDGLIDGKTLIGALKGRHVHLFVSLLRKATGLRRTLITRFLLESNGEGLAITCKSLGLSKDEFLAIFDLTSKVRSVRVVNAPAHAAAAVEIYDQMTVETAKTVVQHWLQDTEYLSAIRQIEQARHGTA